MDWAAPSTTLMTGCTQRDSALIELYIGSKIAGEPSTCFQSDFEETCMASADRLDHPLQATRDRVKQLVREQLRGSSLAG